ncbi:MAG: phospho-sugar mutase [Oscillospiraceae bacterium]|nr:phospho-sugar mutase [Oscillospiraceae bacterium]
MDEYNNWLAQPSLEDYLRAELESIRDNMAEIRARFETELSFGTAGLRGKIAAGCNRMNIYTVRRATQGLAQWILENGGAERGVAIAYDSRNFSPEFALESALVLCANGIRVYLFDALRPTPELSFAVRHLGCISGIVVTASHNTKEYNGYKVYGEDGGQLPPEAANVIIKAIAGIDIFTGVKLMGKDEAIAKGLLTYIGEDVDAPYLDSVYAQAVNSEVIASVADDFKIIYTPIHGTGNKLVRRILDRCGMKNVIVVKEQELPDGEFPTVQAPNPENKEVFEIAIKMAKESNTDLIIGTDPDADRVGIVVRTDSGEYITLTGNQTGVLLSEYILSQRREKGLMPENPVLIKTVVTTEMLRPVAKAYGVELMEVLTGFKFIGEKILEFERGGNQKNFVFGFEESYGYLSGTYVRDKDAVVASMLITEMAAWYKAKGMTLYDALQSLYKKYGTFCEGVKNIYLDEPDGPAKIAAMINRLRTNAPDNFAGVKVSALRDYSTGLIDYADGTKGATRQPLNNMIYFELKSETGSGWIAVRPSGTEPKIKFYFGYNEPDEAAARTKLGEIMNAVLEAAGA